MYNACNTPVRAGGILQLFLALLFLFAPTAARAADREFATTLQTIALGSCSKQDRPQAMWPAVIRAQPDLWLWLGDNIYGDTQDMRRLKAAYDRQKTNDDYQRLRRQAHILGTWDDHDYGVNDGGAEFPQRAASRDLLFDFLDVPPGSPAWQREGAYQSYVFGAGSRRVKVILLDARYFRGPLERRAGAFLPNATGELLGEAQWRWLEGELTESDAALHLLVTGTQFIADEHRFEKWANFPRERQRMLALLAAARPRNLLILSGDRHISEVAKLQLPGYGALYEFTSSGLTHSWEGRVEANRHRVSTLVTQRSFGVIAIDWSGAQPALRLEMRDEGGNVIDSVSLPPCCL